MAIGGIPAWAAADAGTNNITLHTGMPTATSMVTNGTVTDITTSTVRGNTGFNSFGHFNVNAGNTVNLHVPAGKANLVNLVHDSRAVINGNLNGLKDGSIGGNIIFADPHGLVVGASGVVNVGSLTVTTPSASQMSQLAATMTNGSDAEGTALAADLMAGKYNAGNGEVSIQGKVNSAGSVNLFAASAVVGAGAQVNAGAQVFQATVNTNGLVDATAAVRQDGSILIVGKDDVTISGELRALMADGGGGGVQVNAPELNVEATGKINTRALAGSQEASGNITLQAYSDLGFSAVNADGSAIDDVDQLEAAIKRQSKANLGSAHSTAKVNIKAGAVLDAGHDQADKAGNVRVEALAVDRQLGGYAQAHSSIDIGGTLIGKDVSARSVTQVSVDSGLLGDFFDTAELQAMIDKVKLLNAGWTDERAAEHVYTLLVEAVDSSHDKGAVPPSNYSEFITMLPYATFAVAEGTSRVTVAGTADIQASGDLHLAAETTRNVDTANFSLPVITSKLPFNAGIAYGRLAGETKVEILDDATIESQDLSLLAHSQDSLKVEGTAATTRDGGGSNATTLSAAFSMAHTDLKTIASVARNANLDEVDGDVSVTALTEQSLSNSASSKSVGQGAMGGPAVALTLFNSDTRSRFDADLGAHSLSVNAANVVSEQSNSASVQAGKTTLDSLKAKVLSQEDFKKFTTAIGNKVKTFLGMEIKPDAGPVESQLRFGSAVAVGIANHQVEARIGGGDQALPQRLVLDGDLTVTALQQQRSLHNGAESKVLADAEKDDGTKMGISVAASYNQLTQHTRALIGNNTTVNADHIGVASRNLQTLDLAGLDRWNSLDQVFENLKTHVPGAAAIPGKIASVYASATSNSEETGLAGSVAVLNTDIDAIAWVGDNVTLTATATDNNWQANPYGFLPVIRDKDNNEDKARKALREFVWAWDSAVDVSAANQIQQLAIAGNISLALFGNSSDGKAVGGGVNVQVSNNQASAGIGANGTVKGKRVDVTASQEELIIGVTPSAGKGASVAGTGAVVVSVVNSDVNASIHNSTRVDAEQVGITADHKLGLWSAAGALAVSNETGIGAGVAVNVLHTDVQALVGDNRSLRSSALGTGAAGISNARWVVDELLVNAESTGQVGAFSVAGAVARTAEEQAKQDEADAESADKGVMGAVEEIGKGLLQMVFGDASAGLQNGIAGAKGGATSIKDTIVSVPDKIGEVVDKIKGLFDDKPDPGTGKTKQSLALAGSASVNVVGQKTRAQLGDIVLDPRDPPSKGSKVTVLSLNQTNQLSGSGSGAFTLAGGQRSQSSAAIAGAIAYNHLYNLTQAQLKNATLNDNDLLKIQAASAGDQVAMGLGIAAATAGNDNTSVAMSVSGGVITNTTAALVLDSIVKQRTGLNQGIAVTAYDRSRTLLGGGSFSLATGSNGSASSVGGSLVLAVQKNKLSADWLGSTATGFNRLDVSANSAARLLAGALAVAVTTGQNSNSASGAISLVIVDNDVRAKVDKSDTGDSSLRGGDVNVNAQSVTGLSALDGLFSQAGLTALSHTELDLDGAQTTQQIDGGIDTQDDLFAEDGSTTGNTTEQKLFSGQIAGEAVLAIAGNVAASSGKTSVGGAVSVVYTGSDYTASLANTEVNLTGDLSVNAGNSTDVLAAAIGAAGAKENAVSGSTTAVVARGSINANVDMTGKTLKANNLTVKAAKGGGAYSLAGNITASSNNASVGGAVSLNDMQQSAAASVQNGTYILTGDADIGAALQSRIMTAALSGQVSGSGSAVGGAITFNRIADTTTARLNNAIMSARDLSISASQPGLGASIWSVAFNLSAAGGSAGVGGAVAVNLIDAERSASLTDSDVELTGSADLTSSLDGEIWGLGIDAAGGQTAGVGGSVVVNVIDGEDKTLIDNSRLVTTGSGKTLDLDSSAGNGLTIASLTGSVKGGGTAAVGGAISVNRIGADRIALIRNSREISGFSHASLHSGAKQNIYAIALAGGGAGTVAVNGSFTSNVLQGTERAAIEGSTLNVGALDLSAAIGDRTIWSLAGAFGGAGTTAVGIADTNNIILSKRLAEVIDSDLTVGGPLTLASGGSSNIRSVAVGAGGAGTAAVGGSVAINVIEGEERAEINGSTVRAGSVKVQAARGDADVKTLAGNAQGAGTAAVGAAIAVSTINQKRIARIVDSSLLLGAGNALVKAATDGNILTLAVAGVGGGSAGVAFSNTSNNIAAQTRAEVTDSGGSAGNFEILASDTSSIHAGSGGVAGAGSAAVGVGTAINRVDSEIHASLTGNLGAGWALRNLRVDANSKANIIAGILAGGGAGNAAVSTVAATNIIQTLTQARIGGGAQVLAQNNIAVSARNLDSILGSAVSAAGAGNAAIAALATVNVVETNTKAFIDGSGTSVSAQAADASDKLLVDSGALNNAPGDDYEWIQAEQFNPYPNLSIRQHQITGLAVQASSVQQVGQIALSASLAVVPLASAAVSGVVNTTVLGGSTLGYIDGARINQAAGAGTAQNVRVGANSHSYTAGYLAAVAGGPSAAAVGAGVDNTIISRLTQARLSGLQLNSRGLTEVSAGSGQYVSTIIASISGAIVAPGISSSLVILKGETEALVDGGSQLEVGSLKVSASALQRLAPNAASVTGGAVAVSGALATLYNQSVTRAWLGADLNAATAARTRVLSGGTEVTANNSTGIAMNVASAGGGGMAVGGSIGIAVVETTTEAGASQVDFGQASRPLGHLSISAQDNLNVRNTVGAAVAGSTSVGGSANVLVANSATRALFDRSTLVGNQFTLSALREGDIRLNTVTGSVGTSALGGSMGLLLLGSGATSVSAGDENVNAMDELDKGGNGSLSQANSISQADKTGDLTYDAYEWNDSTQKYELVSKTDSATKTRVNSNKTDLGDRFEAGSLRKHETLARASDSSIVTSGATRISAEDKLYSRNLTGAAAVGGAAVGGGFALTLSNARVAAELNGGSSQSASLDINARASTLAGHDDAVEVEAYAGGAGFGVGLGAALAIGQMRNDISSRISGAHTSTGAINLNASDLLNLDIDALGASAGAAAVGIVVASGVRDSNVKVLVADNAQLTGNAVNLSARGEGGINVYGLAAAGGLAVAGTGVASIAIERTKVEARVGDDVMVDGGTGGVSLSASVLPQLNAYALGASVAGGVAVGASYARAQTANTVKASIGNRADVRGSGGLRLKSALEYNRSGSEIDPDKANVRAQSIAGSGGLFLSANATIAEAFNTATVSALTGTHLKLPSGRIEILADGRSHQYADALGVAVGGLAVGASVAKAESDSTTLASLGNFASDRNGAAVISDLLVNANAEDINQAKSVAGSGGVIAGNASIASTRTKGSATAEIGDSVQIAMRNLSLTAEYRAIFGTHANSVNAALAGASGAGGENRVIANSLARIGQNSRLAAQQDLIITANNNIFSRHLGAAASGAGGGVISGQAVYSDTRIDSKAHVDVGNSVSLFAGLNAADYSARLLLRAFTRMQVSESVTLSTGGAIAGGGVGVDSQANLNNTVTIGANGALFSSGSLGAGTYSQAGMSLEALASTWGVAGLADARVDGDLNSNQLLSVGSNTKLEALGNITLSAGDDPEGLWQNTLQLNSVAHSSVRGLIAIPAARADADIVNQANTVLASGSQVLAARNVRVGSYYGLVSALADGEARGYQLGFIPVTSRNSNANISRNIAATLNGTLLAGRYNELLINIAANGTLTQSAGLSVSAVKLSNFNPRQFLNTFADMDEVTRAVIEGTISGSNVGAIELGDMLAAGGTVTVNADSLSGNGTLTANGGPRIQVINQSANYLLVGNALIPDQPGGRVYFTGAASRSQFNGQVNEVAADRRAEIRIDNSFGGNVGNVSFGPAIFLVGDILNQGGLIHISNAKGSLGQFGLTYGQQVLVEVPNGSMTVFQPNSYWSVNSNPFSEWRSFAGVTGSANVALELIASDVYGNGVFNNGTLLTLSMMYRAGIYSDSDGSSVLLFGGCLPASIGSALNCSEATAKSFTGSAFQFNGMDNTDSWVPIINYRSLYKSAVNYEQANIGSGGDGRRVVGGQVGIQARYIDINGTISSGMKTDRSVRISADLDAWISQHGCSNGLCVEAVDIPTHLLTATSGQRIGAKYDFVNQRIQLDDVNASGGGFIYMRGGIISTNTAGRIEVNNGFGNVVIDNRSSHQLQLGNIDTGVGSVGIVQIVDTFKTTTGGRTLSTWYVHDQNSGLSVYDNRNGANSVLGAYRVSSSAASSTTYNPAANLRFEWYQQANLSREIIRDGDNFSASNWVWNDVTPNDPWTVSSGAVVTRALDNVYEQRISGSLGNTYGIGVNYHGCGDSIGSGCHWDFEASGRYPAGHARAGEYYSSWDYRFPRSATLRIDHSVKADNPFQIAFVGNSAGLIDAKTNNNLIIGGRLNNPGGVTQLNAAGNIINGSDGSSFSRELRMTAGGYIGQDGRAVVAGFANNGTLQATSGAAGINLNLTSNVLLRSINAGNGLGDVVLRVNGDLGAIGGLSAGAAHVLGRNLDLYATGAIGSTAVPLRVIAREQGTASGGSTHGNLNAFAVRDVFINEVEGDAWIGQIISETGDVWLKVDNGSLYDSGQRLASDTLNESQRQQIWEKLKLTSAYGAEDNILQGTVKPFQDQVVSQYREYWRLRELGSLQGDTFVLAEESLDFYRPLAELQAGRTGLSDAEVQGFADERYHGHALFFAGVFGEGWTQQTDFQTQRSDFSYTATAAQIETLTRDAIWTEGELRYAIDSTALGSAASTPVGAADPNVSGRNVTLITSQDIGRLADSLLIDFAALRAGNLTVQQAAALAIANAPGDVELIRDEQGQLVSLLVNRTQPFYVAARERFDATTGGALYLQSAGDLNIGTVISGGNARLAAASSILAATGTGILSIGGDLVLLAGTGNLGTTDTDAMLSLDVAGRLLSASAGQHIGLRWLGDDFRIGRIFAVGDLRLDAPNGSLLGQFEGLTVTGQSIRLNARDNILGLNGAALVIDQASLDGELDASAGGDIRLSDTGALRAGLIRAGGNLYLDAQSTLSGRDLQAGGDLQLNSPEATDLQRLSAGGDLLVSALGALRLRDQAIAGGNATWLGASLSMDADSLIQTGGLLAINTDGDMSLGQLFRAGQAEGDLFNLQAGGRIDANGDGQTNLRAERAGSAVMLAQQGIGRVDQALRVDMPELTRTETRQGDIYLRNLSALSGTLMRAEAGNIVLGSAGQSLNLGRLQALGNIQYQGGDLRVDQLDAGGWLQTQVSGDMYLRQAQVGESAELDVTRSFGIDQLAAGDNWKLNAASAQIGTADITGDSDVTVSGQLDLNRMAGRNALFQLGTANIAELSLGGDLDLSVAGALSLLKATTAGAAQLHHSGVAGTSLRYGELNIGDSLTVTGNGDWIGDTALAGGPVRFNVGSADLGRLQSTAGDLLLNVARSFFVDELAAGGNWHLSAASAQVGTADITGDSDVTVSGQLDLGRLTGRNALFQLGAANIADLNLSGDLDLSVTGALSLLKANTGGAAQLHHSGAAGTALRYGALNIGDSLTVTGNGDWIGDTALVGGQVSFDVGSADLGRLQSTGGDLLLNVARALAVNDLHSDSKRVEVNAGGAQLGNVNAATTLSVHTTADALQIGTGISGGDLTLTTLAGSLANIQFGLLADPATPNVLVPSHLKSGANILVRADGDVLGGNAQAQGLLQIFGRNLRLGRAQSLQGDVFLQVNGDASQGHGNISALKVEAENDVGILATGNLDIVNVDLVGANSLRAGRDLTVGIGGNLNVTGVAEVGRDLTFTVGGEIDLEAIRVGRNVLLTSGGAVNLTQGIEAGGAVTITAAGGGITMGTGIQSSGLFEGAVVNGDVLLNAAGDISIPTIVAGNGLISASGHNLSLNQLTASGDVGLLASGAIRVGTSQSGGDQSWHADEDIGFTRLLAGGQVLLDSILDTRGNELVADQGVTINAGWRNAVAGPGSIDVDRIQAPTMSLWAGNLIRVADAGIGQSADLHGQDIELYGQHTGAGQLNLDITGSGDAIANRLVLGLQAGQVQIAQLHVSDSQVQMSGAQLAIDDAQGVDRMRLQTSQAIILMNNASPAYLGGADIQLYEKDRAFSFAQNQLTSTTNAYVLHRAYTHQVLVPNFMEDHEGAGGIQYQGMTAARYGEQFLSNGFTLARLASLLDAAALRVSGGGWVANWQLQPAELRINLDLPEQPSTSEEVSKWEI
ncbi:leukotoxin LktA family filamentous adhesin [Pseudomonas sp. WS 5011]|uniref:leukotoxin LktA family filamentous adhesin n=1 Tax=Pseudomonas sp. WS 5011 TaxID=2717477 RepID=UPI001473C410|nr:leukotoxin LktA family filamentous adhesin [Pseudomonas sp. WS 5011]NMY52176.1 leukotoxin LktA family filamentous adhesin [Pseudomonas sp. WS 5011]